MIEIKITSEKPLEALALVAALSFHISSSKEVCEAAQAFVDSPAESEAQRQARLDRELAEDFAAGLADAPKKAKKKEAPVVAPAEPPAAPPVEDTPPFEPGPAKATYTLEQVRAKGLAAARTHGQPAVKAILEAFGAANMTNLMADQYGAFVERLEGLGDSNA